MRCVYCGVAGFGAVQSGVRGNSGFSLAAGGGGALSSAPFAMIYPTWITLKLTMLIVGVLLMASHGVALMNSKGAQAWLRAFPRSKPAGIILTGVAAVWFYFMVKLMDLGEFSTWRGPVLVLTPVAAVMAMFYMREFLAVRALGTVVLLLAEVLLESAFLRDESLRLLLVSLVYVWIVAAMFWVGMPFTMRNQITWVTGSEKRWRCAAFAGVAYGALLVIGGLLVG